MKRELEPECSMERVAKRNVIIVILVILLITVGGYILMGRIYNTAFEEGYYSGVNYVSSIVQNEFEQTGKVTIYYQDREIKLVPEGK